MSSGRPDTDMAAAGPADGGDGDEDDVAEEETTGAGRHIENKDNRNDGIDEGVSRVGGGLGVGVGGGAGGQQRSGQGRTRLNRGVPRSPGWRSCGNGVTVPPGTSDASLMVSKCILRRTVTDAQQVTDLIQPNGADPNVEPLLRVAGTTGAYLAYSLLSLCIDNLTDNSVPSIWAYDVNGGCTPVAMPMWETPGLQLAVIQVLIDNGADINGAGHHTPIRVAIASCNRAAFELLMGQPGIQLRGRLVMLLPPTLPTDQPTEDSEAILLSFYRQLIQRDPTLATERDPGGINLVHVAAVRPPVWSQQFIESYIDLMVANGADITAVDTFGRTPLHCAAIGGSHRLAASLCRRLTAADVNRGLPNDPTLTPLATAATELDDDIQQLQDDNTEQAERDRATIRISNLKTTIRVLLQSGADIALMPTATEHQRRCRQLVLAERTALPKQLPIREPRPAIIEAQERLQKLKEHRDRHKRRQATRHAKEVPTEAELAWQQREADAKMAALIKEEEAANKERAAAKEKTGGKKKGKRGGKRQASATATSTSTSCPPGGEDDQADSSGAADDQDEDGDALLVGSTFASRAIERQKQTTHHKQQKTAPIRTQRAAHTKASTRSPFSPFHPPTPKHKTTEQPSADRLLLSRPSCVSTADQTPREKRLPGPSASSKLGIGRGLGLPAAAPCLSLSSRAAPSTTPLPSAVEPRESAKRRPFVSSSPSHPPPPPRPLPPAHRPASGADESFPPLAHGSQQPVLPSSSSVDRPSCHRGPPPLVKCPKRVESVAEEGVEHDAGSDVEETGADGEDIDTLQRLPSAAAAADDADNKGSRRPNRHRPSSHSSGAASGSASPRENDEDHDAQTQMAILASLHEARTAAMMMPPPSMQPSSSLSSGGHAIGASAAAGPLGPLKDAVSRAVCPPSSSGHRPSCHRGPPPLVKCPKPLGASLSQNEHRPSPFYGPRSTFDACPSSSSYDDSSAAAPPPAVAAAAAAIPYQGPLGPSHDHEGDQGASAAAAGGGAGGVELSVGVSSREAELQRKNDELARRLAETERRLAEMSIQQHQPSSSSSSSAPPPPEPTQPGSGRDGAGTIQAGGCIICFGEHGPASVMYVPCRHMHICNKCYAQRKDAWHHSLPRLKADNARRQKDNKERIKEAKEPLPLRPEGYLCEQCQTEVVFAGSMEEVAQWMRPFVSHSD
ncbi:unnamed protein product [Vitrella brassicaformis CCMP3155]|uniref:Uncharacterized protein n=1 Tax=Vitrella brassicaformis (strain CCMP3155) TaxID=1169540 RepID=A0A0G4FG41_VITBC|nr:unnamed protein product [Vitrella brassicaformis CCMP3155]|eukprot:CEM12033.1 unnamed protein product [Vitrella brassicaformis CCMP3155]